jgi:hypothetical protein
MSPGTSGSPILFEFFWAGLPQGVPDLICDHRKMLPELVRGRG